MLDENGKRFHDMTKVKDITSTAPGHNARNGSNILDNNVAQTSTNNNGECGQNRSYSLGDVDYMDAVERGDMETAQRMVEEAAEAAGYTMRVSRLLCPSTYKEKAAPKGPGAIGKPLARSAECGNPPLWFFRAFREKPFCGARQAAPLLMICRIGKRGSAGYLCRGAACCAPSHAPQSAEPFPLTLAVYSDEKGMRLRALQSS